MTSDLYDFANLDRVARPLLETEAGITGHTSRGVGFSDPTKAAQVAGQEQVPPALTQFVRVRLRPQSTPEWRQLSAVYFPSAVD